MERHIGSNSVRNLNQIGSFTFSNCSEITKVTFPETITSIGESAFYECSGLKDIMIPTTVKLIGDYAFFGCSSLTNVVIPNLVEVIGKSTFGSCSSLSNIILSNSLSSIGAFAFDSCRALTNIRIPDSVISIGECAFQGCSGLTSFRIPDNVQSIENFTLGGCIGLTSISIGESVEVMGDQVFNICRNLNTINCYANVPPSCNSSTFLTNDQYSITLHVPEGTKNLYENAFYWMEFSTIIDDLKDEIYAASISLNPIDTKLALGNKIQLEATVLPEDTTDKTVIWTSSDSSVATVDETGMVEGVSLGTATIIATCGNVVTYCEITVIEESGVESLFTDSDSFVDIYSTSGILIKRNAQLEDLKYLEKDIYIIKNKRKSYKIRL